MTLPIVFLRAARAEFDDAIRWYDERRIGLGAEFAKEIERVLVAASTHPRRFSAVHGDTRCVRVHRFPYSIFYRAETNRIVVFSIFHSRRDPMIWQRRI